MNEFPLIRRKYEANRGEYRTKRVILEIEKQMTEIIEAIRQANAGRSDEELRPLLRSYQSPLTPPPTPLSKFFRGKCNCSSFRRHK